MAIVWCLPAVAEAEGWHEQAKPPADDGVADDNFGLSVSIGPRTAIIRAYRDNNNGDGSGSAYIFAFPEPTAGSLLIIGGLCLLIWRWGARRQSAA